MRFFFCFILILFSTSVNAQSDFTAKWSVTGLGLTDIVSLKYDLDIGSAFISAHGAATFGNGLGQPSTGTCFDSVTGGVFCNVTMNSLNAILDIGATLNGTIRIVGYAGEILESGTLTFLGLE